MALLQPGSHRGDTNGVLHYLKERRQKMTYEEYPLSEGEYEVMATRRKTEWFMILLCFFSVPVMVLISWGNTLPVWIAGCVIALLLSYFGIRLLVCGNHDWACVTNERVIVCSFTPFFRETVRDCRIRELKNWRLYQSARSSRKDLAEGELELQLSDGKKFRVPQLEEGKKFMDAIRSCIQAQNDRVFEQGCAMPQPEPNGIQGSAE